MIAIRCEVKWMMMMIRRSVIYFVLFNVEKHVKKVMMDDIFVVTLVVEVVVVYVYHRMIWLYQLWKSVNYQYIFWKKELIF